MRKRLARDLAAVCVVVLAGVASPAGGRSAAAAAPRSTVHAPVTVKHLPRAAGSTVLDFLGGIARGHTAIAWGAAPGGFDVFVRGIDGALWHDQGNGPTWSGWQSLGGILLSAPAVASRGPGLLDVFAVGVDSALWHRALTSGGWQSWESLGGLFISGPAASSGTANVLDVEGAGVDHAMWHSRWTGGVWSAWESVGGILTSDPAAVTLPGSDGPEVVVRGADWAMWQIDRVGGITSGWSPWSSLGGGFTSGAGATYTSEGLLLFAIGLDGNLWCRDSTGRGWIYALGSTRVAPAWTTTGGTLGDIEEAAVQNDGSVLFEMITPLIPPYQC